MLNYIFVGLFVLIWTVNCQDLLIEVDGVKQLIRQEYIFLNPNQVVNFSCDSVDANKFQVVGQSTSLLDNRTVSENGLYSRNVTIEDGAFTVTFPTSVCTGHLPAYRVLVYQVEMTPSKNITQFAGDETVRCSFITGVNTTDTSDPFNLKVTLIVVEGQNKENYSEDFTASGITLENTTGSHAIGGVYRCLFENKKTNKEIASLTQTINTAPSVRIHFNPSEYQYIDGTDVIIYCDWNGFPKPDVRLLLDDKEYKDDDNNFGPEKENPNRYRLDLPDVQNEKHRGTWSCVVNNMINSSSSKEFLRVRDNLAPLWPFIGIVLQVIVIIVIIIVSEKFFKKKKDN